MSKQTIRNIRIGLVGLVLIVVGVVGYFVALFQAYGLVGPAENNTSVFNDLHIIMLVQKVCTALIVCGIALAGIFLVKKLFFKS